jgi:hypothetical protein
METAAFVAENLIIGNLTDSVIASASSLEMASAAAARGE